MKFKLKTPNDVMRFHRQALCQGNASGRRRDAARAALLRRVLRVRSLAKHFGLPLCDRADIKAMTEGEMRVYFYNLDDRVKECLMAKHSAIFDRYKFPDAPPAWEWIERIDQLRADRQERNSRLRP
jgi:hypothetical protein